MGAARLVKLRSIPEMAERMGMTTREARRKLQALQAGDPLTWLFRTGKREYGVNESLLLALHPERKEANLATQEDVDDLRDDVRFLKKVVGAQGARERARETQQKATIHRLVKVEAVVFTDDIGEPRKATGNSHS